MDDFCTQISSQHERTYPYARFHNGSWFCFEIIDNDTDQQPQCLGLNQRLILCPPFAVESYYIQTASLDTNHIHEILDIFAGRCMTEETTTETTTAWPTSTEQITWPQTTIEVKIEKEFRDVLHPRPLFIIRIEPFSFIACSILTPIEDNRLFI